MWRVEKIPDLCIAINHGHKREVVYPIVSLRDEYQEPMHLCCINKVDSIYRLAIKDPFHIDHYIWSDIWPYEAIEALHNYLSTPKEETMKKEKKIQTINEESQEIFKRIMERHCNSKGVRFQASQTVVQGNFTIVRVELIVPDMDGELVTGLGAAKKSHLDTFSKVGNLLAFSRAVHSAVKTINDNVLK